MASSGSPFRTLNFLWKLLTMGALLALFTGFAAYLAFSFSRINQHVARQHADAGTILSRHGGLKELPFAADFWAKAVETHAAGVFGPSLVMWVEQTGLFRLITMQSWWTMGVFTLLAALGVVMTVLGMTSIISGIAARRDNSKALGDNLLLAIQAAQSKGYAAGTSAALPVGAR